MIRFINEKKKECSLTQTLFINILFRLTEKIDYDKFKTSDENSKSSEV